MPVPVQEYREWGVTDQVSRVRDAHARWIQAITPPPSPLGCPECNAILVDGECPFARAEEKMRG